mgnify:CR=1 FL=1
MNKQDLIGKVAEAAGLSRADGAKAVEAVLDAITAALKAGDDVRLVGFGSFDVSQRSGAHRRAIACASATLRRFAGCGVAAADAASRCPV